MSKEVHKGLLPRSLVVDGEGAVWHRLDLKHHPSEGLVVPVVFTTLSATKPTGFHESSANYKKRVQRYVLLFPLLTYSLLPVEGRAIGNR